jgi:hypothetical protein
LARIRSPLLAPAVLELFLRTPEGSRSAFEAALRAHRKELRRLLAERDLPREANIVMAAAIGESPAKLADVICELPEEQRLSVLPQIMKHPRIVRKLPWKQWLAAAPREYGELCADAVLAAKLTGLIPAVRKQLALGAHPELVRAVGEIGDEKSVPSLVTALGKGEPLTDALIVETLGRIGGARARRALRERAGSDAHKDDPLVLRALAQCATEEDSHVFRNASMHHDWRIRFAVAEALSRFRNPQNNEVLARLASDPSPIVAQKARSA